MINQIDLPLDVISLITVHLTCTDVFHLMLSCHTLKNLFSSEQVWKVLLQRDHVTSTQIHHSGYECGLGTWYQVQLLV